MKVANITVEATLTGEVELYNKVVALNEAIKKVEQTMPDCKAVRDLRAEYIALTEHFEFKAK